MQIGLEKKEINQISIVQRRIYDRYQNRFDGYCFFYHKYGHKEIFGNGVLRNIIAWNNYDISRYKYGRRTQNIVNNSYNSFDVLNLELECYKDNNFRHIVRKFPINFSKYAISKYTDMKTKCWENKNQHLNVED